MTDFSTPSLDGYIAWTRAELVPTSAIADDSSGYVQTYNMAFEYVVPGILTPTLYTLCIYNLGLSWLLNYQGDLPGSTYFADKREYYGLQGITSGLVNSASDVSTSAGLTSPIFASRLGMMDLQMIKDPYGRYALSLLSAQGTPWAISR